MRIKNTMAITSIAILFSVASTSAQPNPFLKKAPEEKAVEKAPAEKAGPRTLVLPETPYKYANLELPAHFKTRAVRDLDNTPLSNPITDAGATLGRVLFYDARLSANGTTACASC